MRTVLFTFLVAVCVGACGLYFDSHGSNGQVQPDAGTTDGGQQHPSDASTDDAGDVDAGTPCGEDAGGPVDDANTNDAAYPADASVDADW